MPSGARARSGSGFAHLGPTQVRSPKDVAPRATPHSAWELRVVRPCKPSAAPSTCTHLAHRRPANSGGIKATKPLRGPQSPPQPSFKARYKWPRSSQGLWGVFISSFFVALMRHSENDVRDFEMTTAFHHQRMAPPCSSHVCRARPPPRPHETSGHAINQTSQCPTSPLPSCLLARWKNWGEKKQGKIEKPIRKPTRGGVDPRRGGHPAGSAAKPAALCPSSAMEPGYSIL